MRLGIFTDAHYSSAALTCGRRRCNQSLRKISEAVSYFVKENCDRILFLGDLLDTEKTVEEEAENLRAVARVLDQCSLPVFCLMGNHDGFSFSKDEFYGILGEERRPRTVEEEGKTLIFLDACYYTDATPYHSGRQDWKNTFYPHLSELKELLRRAEGDVYVFLHQNLEPVADADHRVKNGDAVLEILEDSGKVRKVFQGHYHPGCRAVCNGIEYVTFPAMCESEGCYFTVEV